MIKLDKENDQFIVCVHSLPFPKQNVHESMVITLFFSSVRANRRGRHVHDIFSALPLQRVDHRPFCVCVSLIAIQRQASLLAPQKTKQMTHEKQKVPMCFTPLVTMPII